MEEYFGESETRVKPHGQNGLVVSASTQRGRGREMGFWAWFDFFSPSGQPLNHSLFLHWEVNPQMMGTVVLLTPGAWKSRRRCSLRKSEGPGVEATARTSSSTSIEVTTLATHGPILLPHSTVLLSPQDQPSIGIPKMSWGTGDTPYPWDSSGCLHTSHPTAEQRPPLFFYHQNADQAVRPLSTYILPPKVHELLESMRCLILSCTYTVKPALPHRKCSLDES